MLPKVRKSGLRKETAVEKKRRVMANKQAKQLAQNCILPALAAIVLVIAFTFFYLYGFGGSSKKP